MQFTAVEEIAAPIETVWGHVTDFERYEAAARRHGGKAARVGDGPVGAGTAWSGAAEIMGKIREVDVTVRRLDAPHALGVDARAEGIDVVLDVELEAVAPGRTRMTVITGAEARSLGAKLLLKPMALAQGALEERYAGRVSGFARRIETAAA